MKRVLITGASGLVGQQLCQQLARSGYVVRAALRRERAVPDHISEKIVCGDISGATRWGSALENVDLVVHLAARTHVLRDTAANDQLYLQTNADGTQALAAEAARHGVRRFIYISSVKVNGEGSSAGRAYGAGDEPQPHSAYATSKWLAEQRLWATVATAAMRAVVVRPPLVYGPGVRANFLRLLQWVDQERLLPLAAVKNRRSLVSVWTLCDLLMRLLEHPAAVDRTWMVSDGEDVSTADLVRRIARAMGRQPRLLSVPTAMLRLAGGLLGKGAELQRLCGSLTVDIAPTRQQLSWSPPVPMEEALARTVSWYRSQ
jgi:UDP-glucose 4-epimerase